MLIRLLGRGRCDVEHLGERPLLVDEGRGDVGEAVDVVVQRRPVVPDERRHVAERRRELGEGVAELAALRGEEPRDVREAPVELAHLVVALRERRGERLQLGDRAEQVLGRARQRAGQAAEVADGVVQRLAVAVEVARADLQEVRHRAVRVGAVRPERRRELGGGAGEVVDAQRHGGAAQRDDGAVGQLGPAAVRRQELHVAAGDEAGRHHGGLRVGRELQVRVGDRHVDAHLRALRRDPLDRADRHPEHHHLVVREQRRRVREVRRDRPAACVRPDDPHTRGDEDGDAPSATIGNCRRSSAA